MANSISNSVSIRLNGGNATGSNTGTFSGGSEVLTGLNPKGLAVGDIDGDGDLDMAVTTQRPFNSNSFGGFSTTLVNNGAGTYTRGETIYTGSYASFEQVFADIDRDGDLDLLVTIGEGNLVAVLVNEGNNQGASTGIFYYQYSVSVGDSPDDVALGDVDGDGDLDLLTVNDGDNSVSVRLNDGTVGYNKNPFSSGREVPVGVTPISLALGDLDGDGDLDVVTTNYGQPRGTPRPGTTVSVRLNQPQVNQPQVPTDLVVSTIATIPAGTYNSITVTSTGAGTLAGNVTVNTSLTVQSGGSLSDGCAVISGVGSFTLAEGATLSICAVQGITTSGAAGTVQVTGRRSFSSDASYVYNGTAAQVTGDALPAQVRNLTITTTKDVTLSQGVAIAQVLTIGDTGSLLQPSAAASVTLLSDATTGTALIVNKSNGSLYGPTTTIQRAIDGSTNAGLGYRHFAPPVYGATIGDLTTAGFTPVVNSLYNTKGASVQPSPTVYLYEESRVNDPSVPGSGFDKGWVSPDKLTDLFFHAQGYTLQLPATAKLTLTGRVFDNGGIGYYVYRTGSDAAAGWSLVGNPYPSPIDWSLVDVSDRAGLDAAMYVFESTGPYTGSYRSYANGIGGNPIIPLGQAFFVRVSSGQTQGFMFFKGNQRVTTFNATSFKRTTADPRPQLALSLTGATLRDITYLYQEAGATTGVDAEYDAVKMPNTNGLNVSQVATTTRLAINGLPTLTAATSVPLVVGVPAAGTYTLAPTTLSNLPAGLDAYLRDAQTGRTVKLAAGSSYSFDVTATQAATPVLGRFTLQFSSATPLATTPALVPELVGIYPNPAHGSFTVTVPAVAGAIQVQAELVNTLGQVVRHQSAALPASGASFRMSTAELAAGVYVLRLQAGDTTLTKRVVVQ